eukprot:Hpha_TRINITY_DN3900_c0_g1::TRINITY_DN3900_c0_g1_i1::g.18079::m.18079
MRTQWFEPVFVHPSFVPPREASLGGGRFALSPLRPEVAEADLAAVRSCPSRLRHIFARDDSWPHDGITLEENKVDLSRHAAEFEQGLAFAYTVFDAEGKECIGSVYVNPATKSGHDAECIYWLREEAAAQEDELGAMLRTWLGEQWPFKAVIFPGRGECSWDKFEALPWRDEDVPRIGGDAKTVVLHRARASGLAPATPTPLGLTLGAIAVWAQGAWERKYIARARTGGEQDSSARVIYLQTPNGPFYDVRVKSEDPRRRSLRSAEECSAEDLVHLAGTVEGFAGVARTSRRAAVGEWEGEKLVLWHAVLHTDGSEAGEGWASVDAGLHATEDVGIFEPQGEDAWLEHGVGESPDPATGIISYKEDWRRLPSSSPRPSSWLALRSPDGRGLFTSAGGWWGYMKDSRPRELVCGEGLQGSAQGRAGDLEALREIVVGFESSAGRCGAGAKVELSSLPWHEGERAEDRIVPAVRGWEKLGGNASLEELFA